jgi:tRNA 2-thiouridine synthesizing protein E
MQPETNRQSMKAVMNPAAYSPSEAFPNAADEWDSGEAKMLSGFMGIDMTDDHWAVVRAMQEYHSRSDSPSLRELHDALEEKFYVKGGMRYLYRIFPGDPVAQGCGLAGIEPPVALRGPSDRPDQ